MIKHICNWFKQTKEKCLFILVAWEDEHTHLLRVGWFDSYDSCNAYFANTNKKDLHLKMRIFHSEKDLDRWRKKRVYPTQDSLNFLNFDTILSLTKNNDV